MGEGKRKYYLIYWGLQYKQLCSIFIFIFTWMMNSVNMIYYSCEIREYHIAEYKIITLLVSSFRVKVENL